MKATIVITAEPNRERVSDLGENLIYLQGPFRREHIIEVLTVWATDGYIMLVLPGFQDGAEKLASLFVIHHSSDILRQKQFEQTLEQEWWLCTLTFEREDDADWMLVEVEVTS